MMFFDRNEENKTGRLLDRFFNCGLCLFWFLFFVGTEDIQMNLEPGARHVMVIWTLMTFNAMKNICKDGDR